MGMKTEEYFSIPKVHTAAQPPEPSGEVHRPPSARILDQLCQSLPVFFLTVLVTCVTGLNWAESTDSRRPQDDFTSGLSGRGCLLSGVGGVEGGAPPGSTGEIFTALG